MMPPLNPRIAAMNRMPIIKVQLFVKLPAVRPKMDRKGRVIGR
jgi:hypothetical protein